MGAQDGPRPSVAGGVATVRALRACGSCGEPATTGARFCGNCGSRLEAPPGDVASASPLASEALGERRQLTVMFCDLVGSTALSGRIDAEDLSEVTKRYQRHVAEPVVRFGGVLVQYYGDGVLVYFGHPVAHEDDAVRAIHAALDVVDTLPQLNAELVADLGIEIHVRIGIHTGLVVIEQVGAGGRYEEAAIGETMNIASRLSDVADPDSVLVSSATAALAAGAFLYDDQEPLDLKGVVHPVPACRVVARRRLHVVDLQVDSTPMVGRATERGLLAAAAARALERNGGTVAVVGDPGMGKSRLVRELGVELHRAGWTVLACRCSPYHSTSALSPVIDLLQLLISEQEPEGRDPLGTLDRLLTPYTAGAPQLVPLLAGLLGIPLDDRHELPPMSPMMQRAELLDGLVTLLATLADERPVFVVAEDVHWIDPSTAEFLGMLAERSQERRVLIVLTSRPPAGEALAVSPRPTVLRLDRLSDEEVGRLAVAVAGPEVLSSRAVGLVAAKADGVPLYAQELARALVDVADPGAVAATAVPPTLQDLLRERLGRLPGAKGVAQLASVIGRRFSSRLLRAIYDGSDGDLERALRELVDHDIVQPIVSDGGTDYQFTHELLRDQAYSTMLRRRRAAVHARVAHAIDADAGLGEGGPSVVAQHHAAAGDAARAISAWLAAAAWALERSAVDEATTHLRRGLALVDQLRDPVERMTTEMTLQVTLGATLTMREGYGSPDVEFALGRARDLGRELGDGVDTFPILRGLAQFSVVRADFDDARNVAHHLSSLAEEAGRDDLRLEAAHVHADVGLWTGDFDGSVRAAKTALRIYDPELHRVHALFYGVDPGVSCRCYGGIALWILGRSSEAVDELDAALALADDGEHPFTRAFALCFAATLRRCLSEPEACHELASRALDLATQQSFEFWEAYARMFLGWSLCCLGDRRLGVTETRRGLDQWQGTGARLGLAYVNAMLGEVLYAAGDPRSAIAAVDVAEEFAASTGERFCAADIQRLRGVVLASSDRRDEAEASLRVALDLARSQGARAYELRAATSLAELVEGTDRRLEALDAVRAALGGVDTAYVTADVDRAAEVLASGVGTCLP